MAMSTMRLPAAFATPAVLLRRPTTAVFSGSLPRPISAGPRLHARHLPPLQAADSCHIPTAPTSRLPSVPRPRRHQAAGFLDSFPRPAAAAIPQLSAPRPHARRLPPPKSASSGHQRTAAEFMVRRRYNKTCLPRASAAAPRRPLPPHAASNPDQPTEPQGPIALWRVLWNRAATVGSSKSSPVGHFSLVIFFCTIKSPAFQEIVKKMGTRFGFPPRLTLNIIVGASMISVVYDLAMGGKDLDEICAYMKGLEKPDTASGDQQQD